MKKRAALLLPLLLLSCKAPKPPGNSNDDWNQKDAAAAEAFRQEYAAFMVSTAPAFDRKEIRRLSKRMLIKEAGGMHLELNLGDRWTTAGQYNLKRTESRYRVVDAKGKVLASAESVMAAQDLGEAQIPEHIRVYFDAATGSFLIDEEHNWSTRRFIAFQPSLGGAGWDVKYFHLPERAKFPPIGYKSTCVGFAGGIVYFECAERTFAMPLDRLPVQEDLGYSIG